MDADRMNEAEKLVQAWSLPPSAAMLIVRVLEMEGVISKLEQRINVLESRTGTTRTTSA